MAKVKVLCYCVHLIDLETNVCVKMSKHFYALGIKITLTSNQVKPADKFWGSLWKTFSSIFISNDRLPNILSDNLDLFLYLLQTSQCSASFLPKLNFILVSIFWRQLCWLWFCTNICSILGFSFKRISMILKITQRHGMTVDSYLQ